MDAYGITKEIQRRNKLPFIPTHKLLTHDDNEHGTTFVGLINIDIKAPCNQNAVETWIPDVVFGNRVIELLKMSFYQLTHQVEWDDSYLTRSTFERSIINQLTATRFKRLDWLKGNYILSPIKQTNVVKLMGTSNELVWIKEYDRYTARVFDGSKEVNYTNFFVKDNVIFNNVEPYITCTFLHSIPKDISENTLRDLMKHLIILWASRHSIQRYTYYCPFENKEVVTNWMDTLRVDIERMGLIKSVNEEINF